MFQSGLGASPQIEASMTVQFRVLGLGFRVQGFGFWVSVQVPGAPPQIEISMAGPFGPERTPAQDLNVAWTGIRAKDRQINDRALRPRTKPNENPKFGLAWTRIGTPNPSRLPAPPIQISMTCNLLLDTPISAKSNLFDGIGLEFLAGSALVRCELCTGGLGVRMYLQNSVLVRARPVDHNTCLKPESLKS